jgi:hypothetical protein
MVHMAIRLMRKLSISSQFLAFRPVAENIPSEGYLVPRPAKNSHATVSYSVTTFTQLTKNITVIEEGGYH